MEPAGALGGVERGEQPPARRRQDRHEGEAGGPADVLGDRAEDHRRDRPAVNSAVFCRPMALPALARPAISPVAVKASPLELIDTTPVSTITGSSSAEGPSARAAVIANRNVPVSASSRIGAIRTPRRSDQRPASTRITAPPSCTTASMAAALPADQPRRSCRNSVR